MAYFLSFANGRLPLYRDLKSPMAADSAAAALSAKQVGPVYSTQVLRGNTCGFDEGAR